MTDPDFEDQISISALLQGATFFTQFDATSKKFTFKPLNGYKYLDQYEVAITLTDDNKNPQTSVYSLVIQIKQPQQNVQSQQNQQEAPINSPIIQIIDRKRYKCAIKIEQVSKNGYLKLKIQSSNAYAAQIIASALLDTELNVFIEKKSRISIQIEEVIDRNIVSIKLELKNKQLISSGMVRLYDYKIFRNWLFFMSKSWKTSSQILVPFTQACQKAQQLQLLSQFNIQQV
ncbi:hypothetical protein FGO68_gene6798 [Halteria grandinella]|uniref:Cadherin domain-containing protein n=1 Tax=Halteria grandinella TaxID=5974 RepID=A0A8J8P401_HALGN|nr:hypothetical protein FGO68_gene6798 [Halteria grandinella]